MCRGYTDSCSNDTRSKAAAAKGLLLGWNWSSLELLSRSILFLQEPDWRIKWDYDWDCHSYIMGLWWCTNVSYTSFHHNLWYYFVCYLGVEGRMQFQGLPLNHPHYSSYHSVIQWNNMVVHSTMKFIGPKIYQTTWHLPRQSLLFVVFLLKYSWFTTFC